MILKTSEQTTAPVRARLWPRLADLFQIRSTADGRTLACGPAGCVAAVP